MQLSFLILQAVNEKVNDLSMKLNYSEPKIYTGGADFVNWSRLKRYHPAKNINANYDGKRLYFDLIDNMTVYV